MSYNAVIYYKTPFFPHQYIQLKKEETYLIAPCGIYCGACDAFLEKSKCHAKQLHRIIKGFNIADVCSFTMGIEQERMIDFLNILEQMSQAKKMPWLS